MCNKLPTVIGAGNGIDNTDLFQAGVRRIAVYRLPSAGVNAVVEFAIGQLFALNRRVVEAHNQVQHGIELMDFVDVNNEVEAIFSSG